MKKMILFGLIVLLVGCATVKTSVVMPERYFKSFESGVVMERGVGEQMLDYNLTTLVYPGFIATDDFQSPPFALGQNIPLIKADSKWIAIAKLETGGYLCQNTQEKIHALIPDLLGGAPTQSRWEVCLLVDASNEPYGAATCDPFGPVVSIWEKKPVNFLKPTKIGKGRAWRAARIIYAGKINKDTIRILYQETALKDTEFTFILSESREVSVKDITFDIIEATNNSIKYVIKTKVDELRNKIEQREKKEREYQSL